MTTVQDSGPLRPIAAPRPPQNSSTTLVVPRAQRPPCRDGGLRSLQAPPPLSIPRSPLPPTTEPDPSPMPSQCVWGGCVGLFGLVN